MSYEIYFRLRFIFWSISMPQPVHTCSVFLLGFLYEFVSNRNEHKRFMRNVWHRALGFEVYVDRRDAPLPGPREARGGRRGGNALRHAPDVCSAFPKRFAKSWQTLPRVLKFAKCP